MKVPENGEPAALPHGGFGKHEIQTGEWRNNTANPDSWQRLGDVAAWITSRIARRHDLSRRRARDIAALTNGDAR